MSHAWDYKEKIPWGAAPPEAKKKAPGGTDHRGQKERII